MEMLNEMAVFVQVVHHAGFSTAARHMQLTTSAVSRSVSRLEAHLGGRLLHRTTRSLTLTELGEQVFAGCVNMLSIAKETQALAQTYSARPTGVLRITAPVMFGQVWLAPRLSSFLDKYPDIDIQLNLLDRSVDLIEEGVDVAIRIARALTPGLVARPLCSMRYVLVATPQYLAQHPAIRKPADLLAHRCIYLGYGDFTNQWVMHRGKEVVKIKVPTRALVNNSGAILSMIQAHGGVGLVPDFTAQSALHAGQVQHVLPKWAFAPPYTGEVHAVYASARHLPLKTRVLIDHLVQRT
jgi:DNA-binding transcriptional LysR family regulator